VLSGPADAGATSNQWATNTAHLKRPYGRAYNFIKLG